LTGGRRDDHNRTPACHLEGWIRDQPGHGDHTWTDAVRVRSVGAEEGFAYVYASADDDRTQFPEDEILIGLYRHDLNCDPDGEANMTVAQAEKLIAVLQRAIAFTQHHAHGGSR
jgi:hypothetical protein